MLMTQHFLKRGWIGMACLIRRQLREHMPACCTLGAFLQASAATSVTPVGFKLKKDMPAHKEVGAE